MSKEYMFSLLFIKVESQDTIWEHPGQGFCLEVTSHCNCNDLELKMQSVSLAGPCECPSITLKTDPPCIFHCSVSPVFPRSNQTIDSARS